MGERNKAFYLLEMEERRPLAMKGHDLRSVVVCIMTVDAGVVWDDMEGET